MTRIIPARAGFTRSLSAPRPGCPDHPRSRGVYEPGLNLHPPNPGSSPLARGLPGTSIHSELIFRIIPARAGFTAPDTRPHWTQWDHPRSRGVYALAEYAVWTDLGSSPLARGLPRMSGHKIFQLQDHPRSRGVYDE